MPVVEGLFEKKEESRVIDNLFEEEQPGLIEGFKLPFQKIKERLESIPPLSDTDPKRMGEAMTYSEILGIPHETAYTDTELIKESIENYKRKTFLDEIGEASREIEEIRQKKARGEIQRDPLEEIGAAIKRGGIREAEDIFRVGRVLGMDTTRQINFFKNIEAYRRTTRHGAVWDNINEGVSSTTQSILSIIPGALSGFINPLLAVPGAAVSAGTIFSLAEYDRFMEEAEELGLSRDEVFTEAVLSAAAEGGFEALTDLVGGKVFGLLGRKTLTEQAKKGLLRAFGRFIGRTGGVGAVEIPGEMITAAVQAHERNEAGFPYTDPWEAAKGAVGPAGVQTILLSGFGGGVRSATKKIEKPQAEKGEVEVKLPDEQLEKALRGVVVIKERKADTEQIRTSEGQIKRVDKEKETVSEPAEEEKDLEEVPEESIDTSFEFGANIQKEKEAIEKLSQEEVLNFIKKEVEEGEVVSRSMGEIEEREGPTEYKFVKGYSAFPEYFQGKGYTKKEVINIVNKRLEGKTLTPKQRVLFDNLVEDFKDYYIKRLEAEFATKQIDEEKLFPEFTKPLRDMTVDELYQEAKETEKTVSHAKSLLRRAYFIGKKEGIEKQKAHYREVTQKAKARQEQRERLNKIIKDLKKIDTKKMSPEQAEPINQLLEGIDLTKPTKKTLIRLTNTRKFLENNPEAELPDYVLENLERLDKEPIRDMTLEDIESLHIAVMHHTHLEKTKNRIKVRQEQRRKEKVLQDSITEMKPAKKVEREIISSTAISKEAEKERSRWTVKNIFGVGLAHQHYDLIIESLAGQNSTMDKVLFQDVKEGITKQLKYRQDTFKKFQEDLGNFTEKHKIDDMAEWLDENVETGKFALTRGQRMALYRHSLNPDNRAAILEGGFGLKPSDEVFKITEEELNEIINGLTPAEKEFAGEAVHNLFENQYTELNKVFYEKNGFNLPKVENYYPKEVMPLERGTQDLATEEALEKFKGKWLRIGLQKGMLKERVGSQKPIFLNSIAYDVNKSVMKSAAYIGLEIPLNNASKLLYDNNFRKEMNRRYTPETWKEIEQGLRDIAGDHQSYTELEQLIFKGKNQLTTAMLGINPFVMAKQVVSFPVYMVYVKPEYLVRGMLDYIHDSNGVSERHKLYSPEYLERIESGFSRDVADVFKGGAVKRLYGGQKSVKEKFMSGIKLFDKNAVAPGMQGAVLQVLDEFREGKLSREVKIALDMTDEQIKNLSAAEKMRLAYKYADYATERTQPMFSPEHRAYVSRSSSKGLQLLTMFGSFTNQALNLTMRSYREARRTGDPEAYKKFARTLLTLFVINALAVSLIDELRDRILIATKVKKEKYKSSFQAKVLGNWAGYFFVVRDVADAAISNYEQGPYFGYDVEMPIQRIPNLVADAIADGARVITPSLSVRKREKAAVSFIDKSLEATLMIYGIPYIVPKQIGEASLGVAKGIAKELE